MGNKPSTGIYCNRIQLNPTLIHKFSLISSIESHFEFISFDLVTFPSMRMDYLVPMLQRQSQMSSEFLYLGTLVNTHGATDNSVMQQQHPRGSSTSNKSSAANSRKFDLPELSLLPPLYGHNKVRRNYGNGDVGSATQQC
ncbi:OLC1v1012547C1 [Oldenlandia corymbosa var. corymbosa]|uniref:OLC1v1012547C1 n=1 Tax=Oldenlandia corymbosa var. corymbosa TaxID=529605 RepID=A0AAV1DW97_OLDCO|nr:OLC1v1012547C1 [Oldenlandia corymbosa var. corymbosa]